MARPGSQVHAILACVKFRNDHGRTVRNKELISLWPHIGMSTLSQMTNAVHVARTLNGQTVKKVVPPMLKRSGTMGSKTSAYYISDHGKRELGKLGEYTKKMWNENAEFYTPLPWERNLGPNELMVAPKSTVTNVIEMFLKQGSIDGTVSPRFFNETQDAKANAGKTFHDWENFRGSCGNPECGHKTHEIHRLWQDPQYETAVLCVTILRCRLCGHEALVGTEDVPVDRVPDLDRS